MSVQNRMKACPLGFERVPEGGAPGAAVHVAALEGGFDQGSLRHVQQGARAGLGDEAVPIMMTEAAVAYTVQGHHQRARGHRLERGQIEALGGVGQADCDPGLGQQGEEGTPIEGLHEQQVGDALRVQPLGEAPGQIGTLVADDRERLPAPLVLHRRAVFSVESKGLRSTPFGIVRTGPSVRPVAEIASATSGLTQIRTAFFER